MKLYEASAILLKPNGTEDKTLREFIPAGNPTIALNIWNYRLSGKNCCGVGIKEIKVDGYNLVLEEKPTKYKVLVEWTMTKEIEVEAFDDDEAIQLANDMDLPDDGEYVGDSYVVHGETLQEVEED